jgi:hypothetical protein
MRPRPCSSVAPALNRAPPLQSCQVGLELRPAARQRALDEPAALLARAPQGRALERLAV